MLKSKAEREKFFSQVHLKPSNKYGDCSPCVVYKLAETHHTIHEFTINIGLDEPIEIAQVTDLHFSYFNEADEKDEEAMLTKEHRHWLSNSFGVKPGISALYAASHSDQIVVTGDTMDFLSNGCIELMKKHIWDVYPGTICTLGGHELTKHCETGQTDRLSLEERYKILQDSWDHDIFYYSKLVKNKVLCVGMDNGRGWFSPGIAEKLKADVELAREKGYILLLFMHEPISTGNPEDTAVHTQFKGDMNGRIKNFYDAPWLCCNPNSKHEEDKNTYEVITSSADVIKGVFNGHTHNVFYTEIKASYTDKDGVHPATIPQLNNTTNIYFNPKGNMTRIIIK